LVGISGRRRCIVSLAIYKKELTAKTGPTHKSGRMWSQCGTWP